MKIVVCSISIIGLSFISFSQSKSLKSSNNSKEPINKESIAKPLSESKSKPVSRTNKKNNIIQGSRKEIYEIVPQKE